MERGGRDVTSNQALVRAPQTDPAEGTAGHGDRLAAVLNNGVEHPVWPARRENSARGQESGEQQRST